MIDPEAPIDTDRLSELERSSADKLGVVYDPSVVTRMLDCIIERVQTGTVGEGITYAELVRDSGVPSWVAYRALLGPLLSIVSARSYTEHGVLVSALIRVRDDDTLPTDGFCGFLEELGLVSSRFDRDSCLEMWDYHWKNAVTRLDSEATGS